MRSLAFIFAFLASAQVYAIELPFRPRSLVAYHKIATSFGAPAGKYVELNCNAAECRLSGELPERAGSGYSAGELSASFRPENCAIDTATQAARCSVKNTNVTYTPPGRPTQTLRDAALELSVLNYDISLHVTDAADGTKLRLAAPAESGCIFELPEGAGFLSGSSSGVGFERIVLADGTNKDACFGRPVSPGKFVSLQNPPQGKLTCENSDLALSLEVGDLRMVSDYPLRHEGNVSFGLIDKSGKLKLKEGALQWSFAFSPVPSSAGYTLDRSGGYDSWIGGQGPYSLWLSSWLPSVGAPVVKTEPAANGRELVVSIFQDMEYWAYNRPSARLSVPLSDCTTTMR